MSTASAKSARTRFLDFLLIFIGVYLLLQLGMRTFFPTPAATVVSHVTLSAERASLRLGHHPVMKLKNDTPNAITLPARCPAAPFDVFAVRGTGATALLATETAVPCPGETVVPAGETASISLAPWKYVLFGEAGTYDVRLPAELAALAGTGGTVHATVTMTDPGVLVQMFRAFVTKPLLNLLVFIASLTPGNNLGIAIITLTVLVKLLLFFPTQHAMEGQRKMQLLQPKMEEVRQKYKGDAQKINTETMKLWKENGVNPFQSCLPVLLQFPVLIGLFFVIRDGSVFALAREFLYCPYQGIDFQFGQHFLGLDLTVPSKVLFPVLLVTLQFLQMKLTFHIAKRKKAPDQKTDSAADAQQKVMLYVLPLMIGFFAFQFPMAVSLYWAVSTVFGIGQQLMVNRKVLVA